jgi:hypothetical protein
MVERIQMNWSLGIAVGVFVIAATAPWLCGGSSGGPDHCVSVVNLDLSTLLPGGITAARVVALLLGVLAGCTVARLLPRKPTS